MAALVTLALVTFAEVTLAPVGQSLASSNAGSVATAGVPRGVDVAGNIAAVADGTAGVSIFNVAAPGAPALLQTIPVTGAAWDVKITHNVVYAASDGGLTAITGVALPPVIDPRAVTTTTDGVAVATVTGTATSVTGQPALSLALATSTGGTTNAVSVGAAGDFGPTGVGGKPGATVTVTATDAASRQSSRGVTPVPFANTVETNTLRKSFTNDPGATMRRLSLDGTRLYATCGFPWVATGESDEIFGFDTTQPLGSQTPSLVHAGDSIQAFVVRGGWAYVAGASEFRTVDLSTGAAYPVTGHTPNGTWAIAVSGNYAFVSAGRADNWFVLQVYDVTNPASPQFVRELDQFDANSDIWGLEPIGTAHLALFEPYTATTGKVVILDISNIADIQRVGSVDLDNGVDGAVDGNTLYVYGYYDPVTLVDITNRAAPAVLSRIATPGPATGVTASGTNEIAVADGTLGVTFIDVSNRTAPAIKGTQQVAGSPADVLALGKTVFAASELVLDAMKRP